MNKLSRIELNPSMLVRVRQSSISPFLHPFVNKLSFRFDFLISERSSVLEIRLTVRFDLLIHSNEFID